MQHRWQPVHPLVDPHRFEWFPTHQVHVRGEVCNSRYNSWNLSDIFFVEWDHRNKHLRIDTTEIFWKGVLFSFRWPQIRFHWTRLQSLGGGCAVLGSKPLERNKILFEAYRRVSKGLALKWALNGRMGDSLYSDCFTCRPRFQYAVQSLLRIWPALEQSNRSSSSDFGLWPVRPNW